MSLCDRAKQALTFGINGTKEMLGDKAEAVMLQLGPAKIVEFIIATQQSQRQPQLYPRTAKKQSGTLPVCLA